MGFQVAGDSSQSQLKRGGVGLQNVDQRLKLHFGEDYQMKIDSIPSKGTTVEIYINRIELANSQFILGVLCVIRQAF